MVSLWPFKVRNIILPNSHLAINANPSLKGEDTSPASFEKALAALAVKITKSQTQLDSLRSNYRRYRALVTIYGILAYLLSAVVLFFVVGWQNWTAIEYTAVAASPVMYGSIFLAQVLTRRLTVYKHLPCAYEHHRLLQLPYRYCDPSS